MNDADYGVPDEPMEDDGSAASPSPFGPIDQDRLEVPLGPRRTRGADLRFATELTWFDQDDAGVTAVLKHRAVGQHRTVRADYLIACDGNHSPTRQRLDIGVDGPGRLFTLARKLAAVVKGTAGAGLLDTYDQEWIAAAHGIGTQGALLVRPDGLVAWRGIGPSPDPPPQRRGVLGAVLSATG